MKGTGPGAMNRAFRLVWNDALGAFVAVSERTRGHGKGRSGGRAALAAVALAGAAAQAFGQAAAPPTPPAATALPSGGQVTRGQAQLVQRPGQLTVNQGSARAVIDWQRFDIGAQATVRFNQPDAKSVALNRVVGADVSQVFGSLSANGQVLLVNPNGIVFGAGSRVDAAGLAASTLQLNDDDFMAGRLRFSQQGGAATVLNQGTLQAADAGYIALLAPEVRNEGVLRARLGTVALAGGDAVTLQFDSAGGLAVKVDAAKLQTLIENRHAIEADGGQVILAAGVARQLLQQAVAGGTASASALVEQDGVVRLVGNSGTLQAAGGRIDIQGGNITLGGAASTRQAGLGGQAGQTGLGGQAGQTGLGGQVQVRGDYIGQSGRIDVGADQGAGGQALLQAATVVQTAQAVVLADGRAQGGRIRVEGTAAADGSAGTVFSSGTLQARSADGRGGDVAVTAGDVQLRAAQLDASGAQGGRVRVGGGFQGGDADLANAATVGVNGATLLKADANGSRGDAGQVVVWSDSKTVFGGRISARGGSTAGAGGLAEVSGKEDLVYQGLADLSSRDGRPGQLLLDPRNLIVDNIGSALAALSLTDPTPSSTSGFGSATLVLPNGNVAITAPQADTGGTADTGAVYLFDSSTGALLANLRGQSAGDKVGSGGLRKLANNNYLVLSPDWGTVSNVTITNFASAESTGSAAAPAPSSAYQLQASTTASAGALTWQSQSGSGSMTVGSGNSLVGSTGNTDSMVPRTYSGFNVTSASAVTVTANDRLGGSDVLSSSTITRPGTRIVDLADGNVAIAAPTWFNGRGAVAWMDASTGLLANGSAGGAVSASTALVGGTPNRTQAVVVAAAGDANNKYYVLGARAASSTAGDDLGRFDYGMYYSYGDGATNRRSTVPGGAGDMVGTLLTPLASGSYVVNSPLWTNGSAAYAGAVSYGATGGSVGAVGSGNSLVGSSAFGFVGSGGVWKVGSSSQHYAVVSPLWAAVGNAAAGRYLDNNPNGAVTWVDGGTGQPYGSGSTGATVSASNSLVGNAGDLTGGFSNSDQQPYTSYNYNSSTFASSLTSGSHKVASLSNGLRVLANGNYLVDNTSWAGSTGAVSFGAGNSGVAGTVSSSNSLVGSTGGDQVGTTVTELAGSNYVVGSPSWANGAASKAGAATWGSGSTGVAGAVSAGNSLVGTDTYEQVSSAGVLAVGATGGNGLRSNYLVLSPHWGNRSGSTTSTVALGAATWGNGASGTTGAVSSSNSLVGSSAGDYVGSYHYSDSRSSGSFASTDTPDYVYWSVSGWDANVVTTAEVLSNGNYVVRSPSWGGGKGAVTWGAGSSGISGAVSGSNSLVGSTADATNTVTTSDVSRTFFDGSQRTVSFTLATTYSTTTGDHVGILGQALSGGRYVAISPAWGNGRGALSLVGASGATGTVGSGNSVVGSTQDVYANANHTSLTSTGDRLGVLPSTSLQTAPFTSTGSNGGTTYVTGTSMSRQVGLYWMNHTVSTSPSNTTVRGSTPFTYNAPSNWYVTGFTQNLFPIVKELSNGGVLVGSPGWNNGATANAGAVTWIGANGLLADGSSGGTLGTANSLLGSHVRDWLGYRLPVDGVVELQGPNAGNFVLVNPQWWDGRGAVTWGSGTAGVTGTVDSSNSLVGSRADTRPATTLVARATYNNGTGLAYNTWAIRDNTTAGVAGAVTRDGDKVGAGGVIPLADGNAVVVSPYWDHRNTGYTQNVYLGYGAPDAKGAVSWLNGGNGTLFGGAAGAAVSAANSLVGSSYGDAVGWQVWEQNAPSLAASFLMPGAFALPGGSYVVASPYWANGTAAAAGAVTHVSAGGMAGAVSTANSLVGSTAGDHVGLGTGIRVGTTGTNRQMVAGVTVVQAWDPVAQAYKTNYLVRSPDWANTIDTGGGLRAGALTWVDGSTGRAAGEAGRGAAVSVTNSLVGSSAGDAVGSQLSVVRGTVNGTPVTTGDMLVYSNLADCGLAGVGAVTLVSGLTGATGPVSWRNSVLGLAATADGMSTTAFTGTSNLRNYVSDINYALLPASVTAVETVAYRPLVWAAPNASSGKNASQALALTVVGDDLTEVKNAERLNNNQRGDLNWNSPLFAGNTTQYTGVGASGGLLGFSASTGADVVLTPGTLTSLLNAGTNVTLQASRDLTVVRNITTSAGGAGGDLRLEAGRTIRLYGSITTDNGDFSAVANQTLSAGVVSADCGSCTATITMAPGSRIDTGTGTLSLRLLDSDKTPDVAGAITVSQLRGRQIEVVNQGLDGSSRGMGIRFTTGASVGTAATESVRLAAGGSSGAGTGGIVLPADTTITGAATADFSIVAADVASAASFGGSTLTGAALTLTAAQVGALLKQSSGFDSITLGSTAQTGATQFGALDFGGASMLRSGTTSLAADLHLAGGSGGVTLGGALVSGVSAGNDLAITAAAGGTLALGNNGITASTGTLTLDSGNAGSITQGASGAISAAALRLQGSGSATLTGSGNSITTLAGQTGTASIKTTSTVTVGSVAGSNGLAASTGATLQASGGSSDVVLNQPLSTTSGDLVVAAGRNVVNNVASNTGLDAGSGRYLVYSTSPSASTEGMTGYGKHYNQTYSSGSTPGYAGSGNWFLYSTAPTLTASVGAGGSITYGDTGTVPGVSLTGFIDGDTAGSATSGSLNFTSSGYTPSGAGHMPVGTYTVNLTGQGTLASALGYQITVNTGSSSFSVAPKALTVSGLSAVSRVYDGTTTAQVSGMASISGGGSSIGDGLAFNGDTVGIGGSATGAFADRHAGTGKSVTLSGVTLMGADAGNYSISAGSVQADITPKALTVAGLSVAASRAYNGGVAATPVGTAALQASQAAGSGSTADGKPYAIDTVSLSGTATATYDSARVASATQVQFGGLTLSGAHAGDYSLTLGTVAATITPKALTVSGTTVAGKVYDGLTTASLSGGSLQGVEGGDTVTLTQAGSFATKGVGTAKAVTAADSLGGADAGNYSLTQPTGLSASITAKALTVTGTSVAGKVYDGSTIASLSGGSLQGLVNGDTVTLTQAGSFASKGVGTAKAVTAADSLGGADAANYSLTQPGSLSADITAKALTVSGTTVAGKVYDGSTTASLSGGSLQGVVNGDTVTLTQAGSFANKNVGAAKPVTAADSLGGADAGNYSLTQPGSLSADISAKALTVSGTSVAGKVYDGSATASLSGGSLQGVVNGDTVTLTQAGSFASKGVGTAKAVTAADSLGGADAANYSLTQPGSLSADITAKALTVSGTTVAGKVYDGSTSASLSGGSLQGVVNGDTVTLTQSGSFASKGVGTAKAVTAADSLGGADAANYSLTQPGSLSADISAKTLTVSGTSVAGKVYDGSTTASLSGGSLQGLVNGDTVTLTQAGSFATKGVGTAKPVTAADSLGGADAGNYSLTQPNSLSGDITAKTLTVSGTSVAGKVYDGSTAASLSGGSLQGVVNGDTVTLTQAGSFASKGVGTAKAVTAADSLGGADAANYSLTQPGSLSADISAKALTVSGTTVAGKVYDGSTSASLSGGSLQGVVNGDTVTLTQAGSFASKGVATAKAVTAADSLGGADAANYSLTQPTSLSGDITAKTLTVSGTTVAGKVYDGSTTASLSGGSLQGVVNGDTVTLTQAGSFANKNVGTAKPVAAADSLGGDDAGNYSLVQPGGLSASITARSLTVSGSTAVAKVYDGGLAATITGGSLVGMVDGDTLTLTQAGSFASKGAGTAKPVTAANSLGGADAGNYSLVQPTGLSADITPKALTISGSMALDKVYDGNLVVALAGGSLFGLVGEDVVSVSQSASLADRNAGHAKPVTVLAALAGADAANYSVAAPAGLTASVTPKAVTVTGSNVLAKVYDGSTTASVQGGSLVGLVEGDTVSLSQTGRFADRNAGLGKPVTVTGSLGGGDAGNYSLVQPAGFTADIAPKAIAITGTVVAARVYDGSTTAPVSGGSLVGLVDGDAVTLQQAGQFADKNAGTAKPITMASSLGGGDAGNYSLVQPAGLVADVTPRSVSITGTVVTARAYDGSLNAPVSGGSLVGLVNGDQVSLVQAGQFADRNAGSAKAITMASTLQGADAGNYAVQQPTGLTADVTTRTLTVSGTQTVSKVYDGSTAVTLNGGSLVGLLGEDQISLVQTGQVADKNVGVGKPVTVTGQLSGANAANYGVAVPGNLQVDITPRGLVVTAQDQRKTYGAADPTLAYTVGGQGLAQGDTAAGVLAGQLAGPSGAAATAGSHAITLGTLTVDANYRITSFQPATLTVDPAPLTLVAASQTKTAGELDPVFTWSLDSSQLRYADTLSVVQGAVLDAPRGAGVPPGNYPIRITGASARDYVLTLQDGVLTVKPSPAVRAENLLNRQAGVADGATSATPAAGAAGAAGGSGGGNPAAAASAVLQVAAPAAGSVPVGVPGTVTVVGGGLAAAPSAATAPAGAAAAAPAGAAPAAPAGTPTAAPAGAAAAAQFADSAASPAGRLAVVVPQSRAQANDLPQGLATAPLFSAPAGEQLSYSATLADGSPLPAWLRIDAQTGQLRGQPPAGASGREPLQVQVTAKTSNGQTASALLQVRADSQTR